MLYYSFTVQTVLFVVSSEPHLAVNWPSAVRQPATHPNNLCILPAHTKARGERTRTTGCVTTLFTRFEKVPLCSCTVIVAAEGISHRVGHCKWICWCVKFEFNDNKYHRGVHKERFSAEMGLSPVLLNIMILYSLYYIFKSFNQVYIIVSTFYRK